MAALLFLRLPQQRQLADPRSWMTQVEVRLVPPPPAVEPVAEAKTETAAVTATRRPPRRAEARKRVARDPSRFSMPPARESTLVLGPAEPAATPGFDREAARAAAREIAGELDTPPAKLRQTREEKLARQIQRAARPDCKDGIPGGLLAPLYLLMEKKDSGCKW
jgi:hypothetical protein